MDIHSLPTTLIPKITTFIKSILPAVAVESISIDTLNKQRIYPKSDGEKLSAGRGQLVSRTQLIIDNSNIQEGKLFDLGISPQKKSNNRRAKSGISNPCDTRTETGIRIPIL
jgi:hypothetical protein